MRQSPFPHIPRGLLLLFGGLVMGFTPAPFHGWMLAWVAMVPLWLIILDGKSPSIGDGLWWGLGYHGLTLSWIRDLHPLTWMGIPWLSSVVIVAFCWVFITLWGATMVALWVITMGWIRKITLNSDSNYFSWWAILVGTALWCSLEWLWSLSPLSWTSLSFTQSPYNLLILQLGQLSGPSLITGAIAAVNGLLSMGIIQWKKTPHTALFSRQFPMGFGAALALLIACYGMGWYLYGRPSGEIPDSALRIGIIQGNIPTRIKLSPPGIQQALQAYTGGYEKLAEQGVDAVVTPEGAFPFPWIARSWSTNPLYHSIQAKGVPIWLGAQGLRHGKLTQDLITINRDGSILSHYEKIKLVPLGEYLPLEPILSQFFGRLSPLRNSLQPGTMDQRVNSPFGPVVVGICYDSAFSEIFRRQTAAGGEFIVTASNNDPYNRVMMAQHHAQDVLRAVETDRWVVRATNTGYSGLVDPYGHTRWLSQPNEYSLNVVNLYRRQSFTPYVRYGDWFTPTLAIVSLVSGLGGSGMGFNVLRLKVKDFVHRHPYP